MSRDAAQPQEGEFLLECVAVRAETAEAKTYVFAAPPALPEFEPGQFLNFAFEIDGEEHPRSYSIASSALTRGRVAITVKRLEGGRVSRWLFEQMRPGLAVRASGPAGNFIWRPGMAEPVLLLTAGSGITPAASMIRSLADAGSGADVVLVHFATTGEAMILAPEMPHWTRLLPGLRVIPVATRPRAGSGWVGPVGRLGPLLLQGLVPDIARRRVYCCGPEGFMTLAQEVTAGLGVAPDRFHTESFDTRPVEDEPDAPGGTARYRISFARSGLAGSIGETSSVLQAARGLGVKIPSSCGKGVCGTCRVKLLSGQVDVNHQGGIKPREIEQGFILACCSRPLSDLVVDR